MGRQLPIAATHADEVALLHFMETLAPIRVYQNFAETAAELWISDWAERSIPGCSFTVWPTSFTWTPTYGVTGGPGCPPERSGLHYVKNASAAPVIEVSRTYLDERRYGRLYWARSFGAPHGLQYDDGAFSRLVDTVWRWVRKNGRRPPPDPAHVTPYFLPDAWARHSARYAGE